MQTKYICQNCNWDTTDEDEMRPISDLYSNRIMPGEIMPNGECPECGAVCFAEETPEEIAAERVRMAAPSMLAVLKEFVSDCDALGGGKYLGREWPDMLITYNKAKKAIKGL